MLGDHAIKMALNDGRIVIDPYDEKQLGPNSYDLRIGNWIVRQRSNFGLFTGGDILDSYFVPTAELKDPIDPHVLWGEPEEIKAKPGEKSGIIQVHPGELILAHTVEFIGCFENIVGEMASRSSLMRMGIAICVDAGLGDVGFASKWTMEVFNHTRSIIPIPVGARVAQMKFHEVSGNMSSYDDKGGAYGVGASGSVDDWNPEDMLPRSSLM